MQPYQTVNSSKFRERGICVGLFSRSLTFSLNILGRRAKIIEINHLKMARLWHFEKLAGSYF